MAAAQEFQEKLLVVLNTNLIRVPKKLKRMTMKEFVAEFGTLPTVALNSAPEGVDENSDVGVPQTAVKGISGTSKLVIVSFPNCSKLKLIFFGDIRFE